MARTPSADVANRIWRAAARVVAERGAEAVTPTTVAAAADVSVQTLYNRFGTIDALIDDLTLRGFRELGAAMLVAGQTTLGRGETPLAAITAVLRAYRRFALADPERHRLLFDPGLGRRWERSTRVRRESGEPQAAVAALAGRALDAGLLLPGEPAAYGHRLWAGAHGALVLELGQGRPGGPDRADGHDRFEATVATIIRGLRPRAQLR